MKSPIAILIFFLFTGFTAHAADLGTPLLSDSKLATRFFDPERYITSGGLKYNEGGMGTLEPQVGLGYSVRDQELGLGLEQSTHKLHAQAGGKFDLGGMLYLSAAAKVPVYTYELSDRRMGARPSESIGSRQSYDFTRTPLSGLKWTGEVGIRLGLSSELNIYYDQTQFDNFQPGASKPEERFGTRFIYRFK